MVRRETRRMNEQEAAVLRKTAEWAPGVSVGGTVRSVAVSMACLIALALVAYGAVRWRPPAIVGGMAGGVLLVAGIICTYIIIASIQSHVHWSRHQREHQQRDVPVIQAALRDATVNAMVVRATAVATIQQFEDEGDGFIFDVGDGQLLFLKGQQYWPIDDTMPWPNTEFEIVRTAVGDRWIGIFCSGEGLEPATVLQSAECSEEVVWGDHEDLLHVPMAEFLQSIRAGV